jgi:probable rRNA maturation factor
MPVAQTACEIVAAGPCVDLVIEDERWQGVEGLCRIERLAHAALAMVGKLEAYGPAVLALSSDAAIRSLNKTFRKQDKPTNVLSFPAPQRERGTSLGDVILAFETCQKEAGDAGISIGDHACHLALHGLLHLLGYDHGSDADAEIMEGLESRLLAAVGIGDPYAP